MKISSSVGRDGCSIVVVIGPAELQHPRYADIAGLLVGLAAPAAILDALAALARIEGRGATAVPAPMPERRGGPHLLVGRVTACREWAAAACLAGRDFRIAGGPDALRGVRPPTTVVLVHGWNERRGMDAALKFARERGATVVRGLTDGTTAPHAAFP